MINMLPTLKRFLQININHNAQSLLTIHSRRTIMRGPVSHAVISTFDMFSIGIGPSSSHTVGPMRASKKFVDLLHKKQLLSNVSTIKCELYGSLALTGIGHGTDYAVLMGLEGDSPDTIDPKSIQNRINNISKTQTLKLHNTHEIKFIPREDLIWKTKNELPYHPNGIKYIAYGNDNNILIQEDFYSVGGGFVIRGNPSEHNAFRYVSNESPNLDEYDSLPPYTFNSAEELLNISRAHDCNISEITMKNEKHLLNISRAHDCNISEITSEENIENKLLNIWNIMNLSIENGIKTKGLLKTKMKRRAAGMYERLIGTSIENNCNENDPLNAIAGPHYDDWLYCWSMAVNEENAMGGKVVTAPTNGAAGVIPAVIKYYETFHRQPNKKGICNMLLTCASIGMLYKKGASLSAAEVGCQGEIGVASSMAAAALCEVMGGNIMQVTNAAEIAMEHSLGLTCDPIGGYVEIPCIERNALGAKRAVNAARLALYGDGKHMVSLDAVIKTMKETGHDMNHTYKETSLAGLAVNAPIC